MGVLGDLAGVARRVGPGRLDQRARLVHLERRHRAELVALFGERVRLLARAQRFLRDAQLVLVRRQRQVRVRHLGDERELRAAAGLLLLEVALQRGLAQVAHAPEQVELEAGHAGVRSEALRRAGIAAAPGHRPDGVDRRHAIRPLHAVQLARPLHVQHGDAQVAVAGESARDELLEPRVGEEVAPADVAGGGGRIDAGRRAGGHRPRLRHAGLRLRKLRLQHGAAGYGERHGQRECERAAPTHRRLLPSRPRRARGRRGRAARAGARPPRRTAE